MIEKEEFICDENVWKELKKEEVSYREEEVYKETTTDTSGNLISTEYLIKGVYLNKEEKKIYKRKKNINYILYLHK